MSRWEEELNRLRKLVKAKFSEFEAMWTPSAPGTATRDNRPGAANQAGPRRSQEATAGSGPARGSMIERALALHWPRPAPDPEATAARLEAQLAETAALNAARVAAAGLVAAYRGRLEEARSLLGIVDGFDRYNDAGASRLAFQWLAADAADRADWRYALDLGSSHGDQDPSGQLRFFAALAGWHLRLPEQLVSPLELRQMADGMPDVANAQALVTAATHQGGPVPQQLPHDGLLSRAVAMHTVVRATPASRLQTRDLKELAALWDRVLRSRAIRRHITQRAAALGATVTAGALLERLAETVRSDLSATLLSGSVQLSEVADGERDGILGGLIDALEMRLCAELDISMVALTERLDAGRELTLLGECHQWLSLRRQVDRLGRLCGASGRLVAFNTVYPQVGQWSIDLWNSRKAHSLANAMFRWIAELAGGIEEQRVAETYRNNQEW